MTRGHKKFLTLSHVVLIIVTVLCLLPFYLLIVASSYSNPINALIAAGYDRTFVIDLRYYEAYANHPFDTAEYCKENDIHKILLLGDVNLFYVDGPESGVE